MAEIYGFGAERIEPRRDATRTERQTRSRMMLSRALNLKTLVAFVGSGMSVPLGYPTWNQFAREMVKRTHDALAPRVPPNHENLLRLVEMQARLDKGSIEPRHLLFYIGFCRRLSRTMPKDIQKFYSDYITEAFGRRTTPATEPNPYQALLELPIRRFVTTNYDVELELALVKAGRGTEKDYRLDPQERPKMSRSFTQQRQYHEELAGFAVADVPGMRDTVFHCHGRYDEPDSIIATEHDYQKQYLGRDETEGFHQSIDLLFGSNPILFVGFGMGDEDLLRPLRMFSAANLQQKHSRLLFALVPESNDPQVHDENDLMLDRYGVHVIPFDWPTPGKWGQTYRDELRKIKEAWERDAQEWLRKPVIRKVVVKPKPPKPYRHYAPVVPERDDLAPARLERDRLELYQQLKKAGRRIVVVTGSGGTGKSWRALRLLDEYQKKTPKRRTGVFFWSSYYTDDWLTGIDRALAYLDPSPPSQVRRIDRFKNCVEERHLLVFDGFERLLRETEDAKYGVAEHQGVRALLEIAANGRAKVVITTRLVPDVLRKYIETGEVYELPVRKLTTDDLSDPHGTFGGMLQRKVLTHAQLSAICALCDGHSYALALAATYLGSTPDPDVLEKLQFRLAQTSPTHRLFEVIHIVVQKANEATRGAACKLLERVAIFMSPVTDATLKICFEQAVGSAATDAERTRTRDVLLDARLLFRVSTLPGSGNKMYTVHPTVRGYVYQRLHRAPTDKLPNFTLAGYTSGNAAVAPGDSESAKPVVALFDALVDAAKVKGPTAEGRALCRAAWGVFRSRFEANTATRWATFREYIELGIRMAMLAKSVAPECWTYVDRSAAREIEHKDGPLYADELAWLYSDVGLAIYSEGNMADTYAVWELSYEIDRVTDNEEESGQYIVQARLHMAGVYLELGKLVIASEYLTLCDRANKLYGDEDYDARVKGYRGLIQHLRADNASADKLYGDALKLLQKKQRNMRALSIFQRHRAALKMAEKDPDAAWRLVHAARSAAEEGEYADLIGYSRSMHGHLARSIGKHIEAQHEFDAALEIARARGIRRLECEVLCELSRLALDLGDWETARARATASLMIANELALGLRRTHGLVVLGLATVKAGKPKLGAAYLRHAHRLAHEQHYLLRAREAEAALRDLGEPPPDVL